MAWIRVIHLPAAWQDLAAGRMKEMDVGGVSEKVDRITERHLAGASV